MVAQDQKYRLVFMGTPVFAARILEICATWKAGTIVGAFTQPDRKAQRGHKLLPSPVKVKACELGIPVFQPETLKTDESLFLLKELAPDFLLVAAYGLLLPGAVLAVPRFEPLNVHASLLPKYRGAAPVQRAIMEEYGPLAQTGVSIMRLCEALDAGPVFAQKSIAIADHTADSLLDALVPLGGSLLLEVMASCIEGNAKAIEQDSAKATYAAKLTKQDGSILWNAPFDKVHAQIRAVTSKPGAHVNFDAAGTRFSNLVLMPGSKGSKLQNEPAGTISLSNGNLAIATKDYWYVLSSLKPQGKTFMASAAFSNGYLKGCANGVVGHVVYE